jgi:hypothetical protein
VFALAWIGAAVLGLSGIGLVVAGVYGGAAWFGVILGLVVASGSIPFIRAARRMRETQETSPLDSDGRQARSRKVRAIIGFYAVAALSSLFMPLPDGIRVIGFVTCLLVAPLVLISEFDVTKRQ